MAIKYRNRVTKRTVTVLEPDELEKDLGKRRVRGKPLDPKRIRLAVQRRKRSIEKMDDSWRWERARGGATAAKKGEQTAKKGEQKPEGGDAGSEGGSGGGSDG
ncbi:MAG: hypothetical protein ACODAE_05565 [Gemmatimonadota bacterium]